MTGTRSALMLVVSDSEHAAELAGVVPVPKVMARQSNSANVFFMTRPRLKKTQLS